MKVIQISEFLHESSPILDVRSPSEYADGHISSAISFPLFSDEERTEVGTLYKQGGKDVAVKRGLDLVGPKMRSLIEEAERLDSKNFRVHCWRGGMRSRSVAWLLETYGFTCIVLEGGYKSYRGAICDFFQAPLPLQVLSGYTGTKKTEILLALRKMGEQVIDLEGLADHQGSSFGNIMSRSQPSTEQFHNLLYESARQFDLGRPIWIEDESFMIGRCALPQGLYETKQKSPHFIIDLPLEERLDFLVSDYGNAEQELLIQATEGIRKKLGHKHANEAIELINEGRMKEAAQIILNYYDKHYQFARDKKDQSLLTEIHFEGRSVEEMAESLKEKLYEQVH